jgi:cytochrome c oxidase subunit 2
MKCGPRHVSAAALALLTSCAGAQSALDPAGRGAERIAALFWWMTAGAAVIWLATVVLIVYALTSRRRHTDRAASIVIVAGGLVAPIVILTALLVAGLALLPDLVASPRVTPRITVSGEQYWWRVRYHLPGGDQIESANEIRLPAGESVEVILESPDVIHAFWIPSIAGKIDMIPGRANRLTLEPRRVGVFRGVCAEYCGTAHALMAFDAVVLERDAFRAWLEQERRPAAIRHSRGLELFLGHGCGACHAIRGTAADGVIGPDLTHFGSRRRLGAGILANDHPALTRWIAETNRVKPGVLMPAYGMLPPGDLRAIALYLEALH